VSRDVDDGKIAFAGHSSQPVDAGAQVDRRGLFVSDETNVIWSEMAIDRILERLSHGFGVLAGVLQVQTGIPEAGDSHDQGPLVRHIGFTVIMMARRRCCQVRGRRGGQLHASCGRSGQPKRVVAIAEGLGIALTRLAERILRIALPELPLKQRPVIPGVAILIASLRSLFEQQNAIREVVLGGLGRNWFQSAHDQVFGNRTAFLGTGGGKGERNQDQKRGGAAHYFFLEVAEAVASFL
jgi:hypothetical protein